MDLIILLMIFVVGFIVSAIFLFIIMYRRSFRNKAIIARQNGKNINDVIWIHDKFKVINRNGHWIIKFFKLKETTNSVSGEFWGSFSKKNNVIIDMTKENWEKSDMTKLVQRGLFLYETSEGIFFPMNIMKQDDNFYFKILDQDNRQFIINEMKNINELTKDTQRMFLSIISVIIGIVVLGAVFFGGLYFLHKESVEGITQNNQVCSQYISAILNNTNQEQKNFILNAIPGG